MSLGVMIYLMSDSGKKFINGFNNNKETVITNTIVPSINTKGQEDEVPHFNLFSIINKFIPH
jgi:hypothetical protein